MCAECEKAKILKYRGFTCVLSFQHETLLFKGVCAEIQIPYQEKTLQELEQLFHNSIDSFLSFYKEIGINYFVSNS